MQFNDLSRDAIASVFEAVGLGLTIIGPDGKVQWANSSGVSLLGWKVGDGFDSVLKCHPAHLHKAVLKRIQHFQAKEWHRVLKINGKLLENLYFPVALGQERGVLIVTQDVTKREVAAQELQRLASTDALTGLFNRQYLNALSNNTSFLKHVSGVIMADINGLKQVNDKLGHLAGDELIIRVAKALKSTVREKDLLFRVGGDEFVIVVCSLEPQTVFDIQMRIRALSNCRDYFSADYMCISVGAALLESDTSLERCINLADQRMYAEKRLYYEAIRSDT